MTGSHFLGNKFSRSLRELQKPLVIGGFTRGFRSWLSGRAVCGGSTGLVPMWGGTRELSSSTMWSAGGWTMVSVDFGVSVVRLLRVAYASSEVKRGPKSFSAGPLALAPFATTWSAMFLAGWPAPCGWHASRPGSGGARVSEAPAAGASRGRPAVRCFRPRCDLS